MSVEQQPTQEDEHHRENQTRRSFLWKVAHWGIGIGTWATVAHRLGVAAQSAQKNQLATIKLSENPALNQVGGYILLKNTAEGPLFIIRSEEARFSALSDVCPHKGCHVEVKSKTLIRCPCHHSSYKIDGTYVSGPAHASLRKFQILQTGDALTVLNIEASDSP